jgi:hypothetical protein
MASGRFSLTRAMLDLALVEDDDAVGERHRFDLIVRHVDHGGFRPSFS